MIPDFAQAVKDGLRGADEPFDATLEVPDEYRPVAGAPVVLVADDGGPATLPGPWVSRQSPRRPVLRMTVFAAGRTEARETLEAAFGWVLDNKPGISRIEDQRPPILMARDRKTGADLASLTTPVIVR